MTEVLISTALGGIVLAGVFDLYVASQKSILGQTNQVQMQTDAKTAMDIMSKELRLMYGAPTISSTTTTNDTISFARIEGSGYSSGGNTATTLNDSHKSWTANAFAANAYQVWIITGKGVNEHHTIGSSTASTLTLSGTGWTTIPDTTSLYYIIRNKAFMWNAADRTLRYQIGTGSFNLLVANVTALTFLQPDSTAVLVSMTAQTQTIDPRTGQYASYTLTDTARRRN